MRKPKALPKDVQEFLQDLRFAMAGWDGDEKGEDTEWADITVVPSLYRRFHKIADKYGA